jgi:hypothetical protein
VLNAQVVQEGIYAQTSVTNTVEKSTDDTNTLMLETTVLESSPFVTLGVAASFVKSDALKQKVTLSFETTWGDDRNKPEG